MEEYLRGGHHLVCIVGKLECGQLEYQWLFILYRKTASEKKMKEEKELGEDV